MDERFHVSRDLEGRVRIHETSCLSREAMLRARLRGVRNGNWRALSRLEKGLYNCALRLARSRGSIVNAKLLVMLKAIIRKLLATIKTRVLQVGKVRAEQLLKTYGEHGVLDWAPEMRRWLAEPDTIFYLGITALFGR